MERAASKTKTKTLGFRRRPLRLILSFAVAFLLLTGIVHLFGSNLHDLALTALGVEPEVKIVPHEHPMCNFDKTVGPDACANHY